MQPVDRLIRIAVLMLVIVSGALLGISLGEFRLFLIAIVGSLAGFLVTDQLRWFRLDGLLANIASVVILVLAMKDFLPEDSSGKLVSVANLLIYLQTLLMFQEKTPRLIWQILVLSLLQVVVAAIFSLNFEGGLLFLFYFIVAGFTLALQSIYGNNREIARRNQAAAIQALDRLDRSREAENAPSRSLSSGDRPILFFDPESRSWQNIKPLFWHLSMWLVVTFAFTSVMFVMIPRHTPPWFGSARVEVSSTGFSHSVDLLNRGEIQPSSQLMFRVSFEKLDRSRKTVAIVEPPYFRGMALSDLVIEDNRTNWRTPHDRIFDGVYQELQGRKWGSAPVRQVITMEANLDPLIYSTMPAEPTRMTPVAIEYCHEISALVRCRVNAKLELAPFKYELVTFLDSRGAFSKSWPYLSNTDSYQQLPMSNDPPEQRWLTQLDPARYPTLVRVAKSIHDEMLQTNPQATRIELAEAMEQYFLKPGRFRYTLDFRDVVWNDKIDPTEDFFNNHRSGHCELFASALTLMLRSQNIPARLVVGFHGGDQNSLTDSLMVRGSHAHAWVEAYLRPEDCTEEMLAARAAGPGGAWFRLDATPPSAAPAPPSVGTDAMDLARTMWQDYVLGMKTEIQGNSSSLVPASVINFLQSFQIEDWENSLKRIENSKVATWFRFGAATLVGGLLLVYWLYSKNAAPKPTRKSKHNRLRRWVAKAISFISPSLGQWVLSEKRSTNSATEFYDRLTTLLEKHGLERQSTQSHRQFATIVSQKFSDHPQASMIHSIVWEVSEIFNEIRFGKHELPTDLRTQVDLCLDELESGLDESGASPASTLA